ncbi:MAG: response regulator transcription factor [Planctomycetota bacterium]
MRVLLIEDNSRLAEAVRAGLTDQSYAVDVAHTGFHGEEEAADGTYDAILLDLMLPDRGGSEVCRNLRRRKIHTPIIMLTALSSTEEKVGGLEAGADDYLAKPFKFDELIARLRSVMLRGEAAESRMLRCGGLSLALSTRVASRGETRTELSDREFALLECLMRSPGRVLSRAQIGEKIYDSSFDTEGNVIDVYIASIRKKIDRGFEHEMIQTIKRTGDRIIDTISHTGDRQGRGGDSA